MKNNIDNIEKIKNLIVKKAHILNKDEQIGIYSEESHWIFDFRRVLMKADVLDTIGEIFWDKYKNKYPFQICSLEVAGIPLSVGLTMKIYQKGNLDMNGFFVRKSRKKDGLMKMIEGTIDPDKKIILVDDIMNSGKSFIRQVEVLEELGHTVDMVWAILGFRDKSYYTYFAKKGIQVETLFDLDDLTESIGPHIKNRGVKHPEYIPAPFTVEWKFAAENPNYFYVVSKSNPILDDGKLYFGSDNGYFWAINQNDGSVAWKFKVGLHVKGKSIFSTPVIHKDIVIFGSYDGNLYALDKKTGQKKWVFFDADWIGSSPALDEKNGMIFVGLEFGLFRKKGGIAAVDIHTGKKIWLDQTPSYIHSSPLFIPKKKIVVVGSNDGIVRAYRSKDGKKLWEYTVSEVSEEEILAGFSHTDIKESFAYDAKRNYIIFGSTAPWIVIIDASTGKEVARFDTGFGSYSTPHIYDGKVYSSSLDKHLYCIDLDNLKVLWKWHADARIFSTPTEINGSIYVGSNTGRMSEINPNTGELISFITVPERITGKVVYNKETDTFFLPTFANEIYCLKKRDAAEVQKEIDKTTEKTQKEWYEKRAHGWK